MSQSQWEEFCHRIDVCVKDAKNKQWPFVIFLIFFMVFTAVLAIIFSQIMSNGLIMELIAGGMSVCALLMLICLCATSRRQPLNINSAITLFQREIEAKSIDISLQTPQTTGGPYKIVIMAIISEATPDPLTITSDGSTEQTPLIFDRTPGGSEVASGLPSYNAV